MFESIINFFKKIGKQEKEQVKSKDAAKERLHLVLMQDRANVSADFLDLMKQEIIEVIKKYIDVDENAIDVRLTNKSNNDGTTGAPALYANIPIISIKEDVRGMNTKKDASVTASEEPKKTVKKEPKADKNIENSNDEETSKDNKEKVDEEKEEKEVKEDNKENVENSSKEETPEKVVEEKEEKTSVNEEEATNA